MDNELSCFMMGVFLSFLITVLLGVYLHSLDEDLNIKRAVALGAAHYSKDYELVWDNKDVCNILLRDDCTK